MDERRPGVVQAREVGFIEMDSVRIDSAAAEQSVMRVHVEITRVRRVQR